MKKIIVLSCALTVLILACHKKAVPVITTRTEFPEAPKTEQKPLAVNSPEAIAAGKTIYDSKCGRCHELKELKEFTADKWTEILQSMIPKARLNEEQGKEVTAYVMAGAKK